jgi:hypothetical protein
MLKASFRPRVSRQVLVWRRLQYVEDGASDHVIERITTIVRRRFGLHATPFFGALVSAMIEFQPDRPAAQRGRLAFPPCLDFSCFDGSM